VQHDLQREGLVLGSGWLRPLLVWCGYWIDGDGEMKAWEIMEDDDEMKIIESGSLEKGHGWHSYIKVCGDVDDVKNANIIAAAPELLEALQEAVKDLVAYQINARKAAKINNRWEGVAEAVQPSIDKARDAINKALGR
jgi:hypothetical protein